MLTDFQKMLADDAAKVFCDPNAFGEPVIYTPKNPSSGNPIRTINAVVVRDPPIGANGNQNAIAPKMKVSVPNSCKTGIDSSTVDTGGDTLTVAYRIGQAPQAYSIRWPDGRPTHDYGMLSFYIG